VTPFDDSIKRPQHTTGTSVRALTGKEEERETETHARDGLEWGNGTAAISAVQSHSLAMMFVYQ